MEPSFERCCQPGYDFKNCDNESEKIEEIAKDVSEKLHATPSRDFDGMVGLEGIGKSTIARALHSLHSNKFQLTCFVDNLTESYPGIHDEYGLKLHIQAELLSKILNLKVFFNYTDVDLVIAMLDDNNNNLDIKHGLKILSNKSLIDVYTNGSIVMHKLLQQVGTKAARREEPWKRKILMDTQDICDVLEDEDNKEYKQVSGILFDTSGIKEVFVNKKAFKRMSKLQFLKVMKSKDDGHDIVHIPEDMDFPRRLRFFDWEAYPGKAFPRKFNLENLVELNMRHNKFEKLWEGALPLTNLKIMDLFKSSNLKELPDFSNATNLESLNLARCQSLVELPSSIGNLQKLEELEMDFCINLEIVPTGLNLASLEGVNMMGCPKLRKIPEISTYITDLTIGDTMLEESPELWSRLESLVIYGNLNTSQLGANIEKLPDCIKDLHGLKEEHLLISDAGILENDGWLEHDNKISFEFSTSSHFDVIECAVQIIPYKIDGSDASCSLQDDNENLYDGSNEDLTSCQYIGSLV
ncbi:hypothetical protein AALP_AA2G002200 [Arabis alpina]|uniref:Disease resistance protein Roq1-like winged-helix domain-containing protein n=1 Tax=Arabis alpina TaxID=50452 RepID=A0A087HED5_ARAAL|nr:hypothetical protein AALP_AA2G002200 [Arabis alpina]